HIPPLYSFPTRRASDLGRDIAVVDIYDVVHFLAAELSPEELRAAVNQAFTYLSDRKLSGRPDLKDLYIAAVRDWLDAASLSAARSEEHTSELQSPDHLV